MESQVLLPLSSHFEWQCLQYYICACNSEQKNETIKYLKCFHCNKSGPCVIDKSACVCVCFCIHLFVYKDRNRVIGGEKDV